MKPIRIIILAFAVFGVSMCATAWADSLYPLDDEDSLDLYHAKPRNYQIGDIVLVNVTENALGSTGSKTDISGEHKTDVSFNNTGILDAILSPFWRLIGLGGSLTEKTKTEYKGDGDTDRKGKVEALVSVLVVDITENDYLVIEGRKEVKINHETQILIVSGIIRPEDIDEENTVVSYKIADTRVEYIGEGQITKKMKPGFLSRVFDIIF
ncbi:flagellar basal body L-ring protein FlgH [bacterium]|nr:flagellar basal body L-ring protein FlgH [bacterium]